MKPFSDNFSRQSAIYSKYRPHYPKELFEYLASLTIHHNLALDCGTGNGQSAIGLVDYFKKVIATDPSEEQIKHAQKHERIEYRIERAEQFQSTEKINLITCANSLHWFDHAAFYGMVDKGLEPSGILAAWAYGTPSVSNEIDAVTKHLHDVVVGDFWSEPNRLVDQEYKTLPFPYPLIETPQFYSKRLVNLDEFIGYFNTWSATQKFIAAKGYNPIDALKNELLPLWGDENLKREVCWKLILKVGRKASK